MEHGNPTSSIRINIAIGLISACIIAFQLILMQILSYEQWYHFAYMIISIALLGFGAAGTFLTIFQKKLEQHYATLFPFLLIVTAILIPMVVGIANSKAVRFDSLLIFQDSRHIGKLILTYFIFFLPFFTGALSIGMSFSKFADQIGKIYFSNLIGSGIGGIVALLFMQLIIPEQQPVAVAILAFLGGIISLPRDKKTLFRITISLSTLILVAFFFCPPQLTPSEYKDITRTMLLPEAKVEYAKSTPNGFLQIVSSPVLRYAPGVSLAYQGPYPIRKVVFNNGNWTGCLLQQPIKQNETSILDYTPQALPYHIEKIENALIIDAGTGENVLLALSHQVPHIITNESHPEIFNILNRSFAGFPQVQPHQTLSRTLLTLDTHHQFDLIELPVIGSFFGNSGLNAVEPRYELTIEAMQEMWNKLSEKGMISSSCWMDYPVRNAYRLLSTISLLLDENNITRPREHVVAIRSWGAVTFLVKKSPFNLDEIDKVHQFCDNRMFDPLILPGKQEIDRNKFNMLQDTVFFIHIDQLLSPDKKVLIHQYPYRIHPTTDNRPFFFQFIRFKQIPQLISSIREKNFPFLDIGYLLIILTFIQIILIAAIIILLPLSFKPWKSKNKKWVIVYFSGLGLAYMFLEMVFIQQFTFYFGEPTYATSATLSILLFTSGLGSYYSSTCRKNKIRLALPLIVAAILIVYAFILSPILSATIGVALPFKIVIAIVLLGIPGFFLGMPFPIGIDYLAKKKSDDIPWAWALNGYFSVISTVLAIIISVEAGYFALLLMAALTYALVSISNAWIKA